jgi:SAM-dependent methyltransferase
MSSLPVKLVCPRCRAVEAPGTLRIVFLEPDNSAAGDWSGNRCPACGQIYPKVEGIHCVPPDLDAFRQAQAAALDPSWKGSSTDHEGAALACSEFSKLDPDSASFREAFLPGLYAAAHFPERLKHEVLRSELACNLELMTLIREWLRRHPSHAAHSAECALDVGCGPGRLLHEIASLLPKGIIGFDLRLSMLRIARRLVECADIFLPFRMEGRRFMPVRIFNTSRKDGGPIHFVQGDILSPPFLAEVFPLVSAISLLDTVPDPIIVLGQLDALLCRGGLLLLAAPYHWEPGVTSPENWLSTAELSAAQMVRQILAGRHPCLSHLDYEILEEEPSMPWAMPSHGRLVHRFFLDVILARKKNGGGRANPC